MPGQVASYSAPFGMDIRMANLELGFSDVSVIDTATNTVIATIPAGFGAGWVAISPNGAVAYVANLFSGQVSVIDTATNTIIATIPVGGFLGGIDITPNGASVYLAQNTSNTPRS